MKKKVLFGLVLLTMVGASTAFGQKGKLTIVWSKREGTSGDLVINDARYAQFVGWSGGNTERGQFGSITDENGRQISPKEGFMFEDKTVRVVTSAGGYFTFITYMDAKWWSPTSKTRLYVVGENTTVTFWGYETTLFGGSLINFTLEKGTIYEDKSYFKAVEVDEILDYLSYVDWDYALTNKIKDMKKESKYKNNPEQLARDAVLWVRSRTAVQSGLMGAGSFFVIPMTKMDIITKWIYKAEIATLVALAYDRKVSQDQFKMDLVILLGNGDAITRAKKNKGMTITGSLKYEQAIGIASELSGSLHGFAAEYLAKEFGTAVAAGTALKIAGPLIGAGVGSALNAKDTTDFINRAIDYYKK